MAVIVNLPLAVEHQLTLRATSVGQTLEEYLQRIAAREAEGPEATTVETAIAYPPGFSAEERSKAIREWAERHPRVDHVVDDSRESIYAGRGE